MDGGSRSTLIPGAYRFIIVLRDTGAFYFIQGGLYRYPTLVFIDRIEATASLYPAFSQYVDNVKSLDDFCVPTIKYTPTALVSDTFTRDDGAIGAPWANVTGTGTVASGVAVVTPDTGVGIVTTPSTKGDNLVIAKITRSAGTVGIITHYVDADNYIRVIHDGTNVKIIQRLSGTESDLASAAVTYAANKYIMVEVHDTKIRAWYNNIHSNATAATVNAALVGATTVGLWSSDAGNTIDNFECYARGTDNEYSNMITTVLTKGTKLISCDGDSLTLGSLETSYPAQLSLLYTPREFVTNYGISGQKISDMITNSPAKLDGHCAYWNKNILVVWAGTNDLAASVPAATVYANIVAYCSARRSAGYKVVILTILPRGTFVGALETARLAVNTNITTNWATFADAVVDVASNEYLDDCTDTTYFNADKVHLIEAGNAVVAGLVKTAVDAL